MCEWTTASKLLGPFTGNGFALTCSTFRRREPKGKRESPGAEWTGARNQRSLSNRSLKVGSETRKRDAHPIKVRVSAEEKAAIQTTAGQCSVSIPELIRRLALGYQPASKGDAQAVRALCKLSGDLGRPGGLLKLWLSGDEGWNEAGVQRREVRELLSAIGETRKAIHAKVESL